MKSTRILRCAKIPLVKSTDNPLVKPSTVSCSRCKFFNTNRTCRKFLDIEETTNNLVPRCADSCRKDNTLCGPSGVFYREKTEEDIQEEEEDISLWSSIKYPLTFYVIMVIVILKTG